MNYKKLIRGIISYIPILKHILRKKGTGGSNSAEYCFKTWEGHSNYLYKNGFKFPINSLAEIGPGDSLGIGLTALLTGTKKYISLDNIRHSSSGNNNLVLDELVKILRVKLNSASEIPPFFNKEIIEKNLQKENLMKIRSAISNSSGEGEIINYIVPWQNKENIQPDSLDLVISHAVMEHVLDLESVYSAIYKWLKPGGYGSHVIDYKAHELSDKWFEHWEFSETVWRILMHGRIYPINRMPYSFHKKLFERLGFIIMMEYLVRDENKADPRKINARIKDHFIKDDLNITSAHFIIQKPL